MSEESKINVELMAKETLDRIVKDLEKYHETNGWEKFFKEDALDLFLQINFEDLLESPDEKEVWGFSIDLSNEDPRIELLCDRGHLEIIYYYKGFETKTGVPSEICHGMLEYLTDLVKEVERGEEI